MAALQSVFFDAKPKQTVVCNQSSHYAKTLKVNTAPRGNMANLSPKQAKRCNQSSLVGTLKWTTPRHRPSVELKPYK